MKQQDATDKKKMRVQAASKIQSIYRGHMVWKEAAEKIQEVTDGNNAEEKACNSQVRRRPTRRGGMWKKLQKHISDTHSIPDTEDGFDDRARASRA